jgi:uncharacterized protein (TIGR00255 family)
MNNPIRSMTGFGRGRHITTEVELVTEVKAVNHRFLDISVRLPRVYGPLEPQVRKLISEKIGRGKIDVTVTRAGGKGGIMEVVVDDGLAASFHRSLVQLKERYGLKGDISVSDMLTLKEIIVPLEKDQAIEQEWPLVRASLLDALEALDEMRTTEGRSLWHDIEMRLASIRETANLIAPLTNLVTAAAKEKLAKRIQELTGGLELDQDRLIQEVALMADKSDITEELIRLQSHVEQFLACGREGSPLGRKLDFLLQEFHREVNTLGSKSASTDIASHVVTLKTEVEKIREQTQNLE